MQFGSFYQTHIIVIIHQALIQNVIKNVPIKGGVMRKKFVNAKKVTWASIVKLLYVIHSV